MVLGAVYTRQAQYPVNPLKPASIGDSFPTMRYYRLWIYTCNALLFVSAIGFSIVLAKVLILDPRRLLVPWLSLTQPSFLYAYAALLFQSGVIQTIGCLGASRLNDRLLNVYLLLLLALLLGDILLGVVWLFSYDRIANELRPLLNHSLVLRYGVDSEFTSLWDAVQSKYRCCGVYGYHDFVQNNLTIETVVPTVGSAGTVLLPSSCCGEPPGTLVAAALRNFHYAMSTSTTTTTTTLASFVEEEEAAAAAAASAASSSGDSSLATGGLVGSRPSPPRSSANYPLGGGTRSRPRCTTGGLAHANTCHRILLDWLNSTAHILFVLGYCVIAFIKLCFLGILRYEIREMIQKIKLVQESEKTEGMENSIKCAKQNNGTILQAPQQLSKGKDSDGAIGSGGGGSGGGGGGSGGGGGRGGNNKPDKRHVSNVLQDAGTDSDTNSHCALILCDGSETPAHNPSTAGGANGNNNYEMGDLAPQRRSRT